MNSLVSNFQSALEHSFIDQSKESSELYKAKLLANQNEDGSFVLNELLDELNTCEDFFFAVAFITESGLMALKTTLSDLAEKGIKGKIITSNYLYFNSPKMFNELLKLKNVEIRITNMEGFHAKGYYFNHKEYETMILGSSNLTIKALKVNCEWNLKINSLLNGDLIYSIKKSFDTMWNASFSLTKAWVENYELNYQPIINTQKLDSTLSPFVLEKEIVSEENASYQTEIITPNHMQKQAIQEIQKIRDEGKKKAIVISATGTGKTYLSAFDVQAYSPKRLLFIVHREQILQKAMNDYQKILGGSNSDYGILSGNQKITNEKYVFATIQTLSKSETLQKYATNEFDYILIDEVHRAGAETYRKIIDYFNPEFLLGMTATPERTDGFNIYELFDYNIAYEIRLQDALKEDMLCPFHYFGITDLQIDGHSIDDKATFNQLVSNERMNYILEKMDYYGYSGESVRGLIFCSRKDEANELELIFNNRGFRTKALTGVHSIVEREKAVKQLENGQLDYLITVDIFNEGIDIPSINQVVMLRKTESSIIFIQQLGRGLRKASNKEFVTIIDFIGNYDNNYLIPIALTGDSSLNKNDLRKKTMGTKYISGLSTINFDEISKNRIFQSIETSTLNSAKNYKEAYQNLKNKIGKIPKLLDYIENDTIDPLLVANYRKNYPEFLKWMKEDIPELTEQETKRLTFLSKELLNGKRNHEMILLNKLIESDNISLFEYTQLLKQYDYTVDTNTLNSVNRMFSLEFFVEKEREKYGNTPIILQKNDSYQLAEEFKQSLKTNSWFKKCVVDLIQTSFKRSERYDLSEVFTYNEVYSRKDACRLLNWENDEQSTIYGYRMKYNTCPIFINYHKEDDISNKVKYADELLDRHTLLWYTKARKTMKDATVKAILNYHSNDLAIHAFVQKEVKKASEFIYLGRAYPKIETAKEEVVKDKDGKDTDIVSIEMKLANMVPLETYDFIKQK